MSRQLTEEQRAKKRAANRAWRARHLERKRASDRARYARNRETLLAYQRAWRARHRQQLRAAYRRYRESAHGQQTRAAYAASEARKAVQRRYDQSANGKRRHVRSNQQHKARYPDHVRARNALNSAIRRGKLHRQSCVTCGSPEAEAHHEDYRRPLAVIWLCVPCHRAHHRGEREALARPREAQAS